MKKSALRFLSFLLILNLTLTHPALALRIQAGLESETAAALQAGLEEYHLSRRQFLTRAAIGVVGSKLLTADLPVQGQPARIPDTLKPADPRANAQTKQLLNYFGMLS